MPSAWAVALFTLIVLLLGGIVVTPAVAQLEKASLKPNPTETRSCGEWAEGQYERLVLRNVMVLPGQRAL